MILVFSITYRYVTLTKASTDNWQYKVLIQKKKRQNKVFFVNY